MRTLREPAKLVWVAVGAAPAAWATQHVAGVAFGLAQCNPVGAQWMLAVHGWDLGIAIGAALVALAGSASALLVWRDTKGEGEGPPPASRIHFMAVVGLTTSPLFLAIIVLNGLGSGLVDVCRQS